MSQPPPQLSPDGRFYWDGERWVPMQTPAPVSPVAAQKTTWGGRRIAGLILLGVIALIVLAGLNHATSEPSNNFSATSPTAVDPATYKASAQTIPYPQLEKDPASLAGTVVTYTGQVVQYDTNTGTAHLRINVTPTRFSGYTDTIWLDVDPSQTAKVFRDTVITFWGDVVGPHTYTSVTGAQITIPEVRARFLTVS